MKTSVITFAAGKEVRASAGMIKGPYIPEIIPVTFRTVIPEMR